MADAATTDTTVQDDGTEPEKQGIAIPAAAGVVVGAGAAIGASQFMGKEKLVEALGDNHENAIDAYNNKYDAAILTEVPAAEAKLIERNVIPPKPTDAAALESWNTTYAQVIRNEAEGTLEDKFDAAKTTFKNANPKPEAAKEILEWEAKAKSAGDEAVGLKNEAIQVEKIAGKIAKVEALNAEKSIGNFLKRPGVLFFNGTGKTKIALGAVAAGAAALAYLGIRAMTSKKQPESFTEREDVRAQNRGMGGVAQGA